MLESFKRWIAGPPEQPDWSPVADWAGRRQALFKRTRDRRGFVVDGALDGRPWRLEWGPPQRSYIEGSELRLRMELGLPADLQMLLVSRPLMETLERQTFERYTEQLQTQIDTSTPEEMRWLAMLPKVPLGGSPALRTRFGAVALVPRMAAAWIDGPLALRLAAGAGGAQASEPPLVLMTLRGRLYLRTQLQAPDPARLDSLVDLFECAAAQASSLIGGASDAPESGPSTESTAWQTQLQAESPKG